YSQNVNIDSLDVPIRKGLPGSVTWRINPFEILPMGTRISFPGWGPHGFGTLVFSFSRPLLVERDRQRHPPVHARRIVVPIILADTSNSWRTHVDRRRAGWPSRNRQNRHRR